MYKHIALTLLLLISRVIFSQGQIRSFSSLNVKDGLSQSSVLAIVQDNDGFMWFGTRYGLNRYDGQRFKIYSHDDTDISSLSDNYINTIYKDRVGRLWVGTAHGLDLYDAGQDRFRRLSLKTDKKSTIKLNVHEIIEDHQGNLWVGTERGLFFIKNVSSGQDVGELEEIPFLTKHIGADILSIYRDQRKTIWVSSSKGLFNLNYNQSWSINKSETAILKIPKQIKSIVEDDDGNIWFGSESDGLFVLDPSSRQVGNVRKITKRKNTLISDVIRKIIKCSDGQLAIATQEGLSLYDRRKQSFTNFAHYPEERESLSQNSVYSLYEDYQGSLWVGTYFGGVNIAERNRSPFYDLFSENRALRDQHQVIRAIQATKEGLWIGSEGGGLSFWNTKNNAVKHYKIDKSGKELTTNFIKSILIDRKEQIWVGTSGGGLKLVDKTGNTTCHYDLGQDAYNIKRSAILSMYQDPDGLYWFGGLGYNRIYRQIGHELMDVTPEKVRDMFKNQTIVSFHEGNRDDLWILTEKHLYRYDFNDHSIRLLLEDKKGFTCVLQDNAGILWLGKYYGGVIAYDIDQKKIVARWDQNNGLTNDNVVGIIEDGHKNIWITTQSGLNMMDANRTHIKTFTSLDGIKNDAFNYNAICLDDQTVYLGSLNGLTYFNLHDIKENQHLGNLVFSGLRLFGGKLEQADKNNKLLKNNIVQNTPLVFESGQRVFTIEFALLSFIKYEKNRYAYLLDGSSDNWTISEKGEATFTNLAAGTYTLMVKAQNNDGMWTNVKKLSFTILPPFWKTWWAYLIYFVIFSIVVFIIIRYFYLQELQNKDRQLHQLKMNFFTNISHEIRTHLTLIMAPIENAIYDKDKGGALESHLLQAKDSGGRLLRLVNELMDFRKADSKALKLQINNIQIADLLDPIAKQFEQLCQDKRIDFVFKNKVAHAVAPLDSFQFEKVIFNLLSNALKYTISGGRIQLSVNQTAEHIIISVENSGKGIDPAFYDRIFQNYFQVEKKDQETGYGIGLALSQQIVQLHQGTIGVESDGGVTRFTIRLPIALTVQDEELGLVTNVNTRIINDGTPISEQCYVPGADGMVKILVVEDNPKLLQLLVDLLRDGYEVLKAKDGEEGMTLARTLLPELVISDVMMPKMDGNILCNTLKNDPLTSHIPVVLLTAKTLEKDEIIGLTSGADVYVTKPFNRDILLLHVRNLLLSRNKIQQKYRQEFVFGPRNIVINNLDEEFLSKFIKVIEQGIDDSLFDVEYLAENMAMSQSVLYKKVRALTGMTINDFSKSIRLKRAAELLEMKSYTVSDVAFMVGFMDSKYFAKEFKKYFGVSPSQYANKKDEN